MGIFNPEHGIYRLTEKIADLLILSVFWLVCSIPLVTLGPATTALYNTVVRCILGDERNSWVLFFRTFKQNFKVGALTSLVVVPLMAVLVILHEVLYQMALTDDVGYTLFFAYRVFLLLPIGFICYLFPVLSRFTFQVSGLLANCGKLAIAHLPSTVLMAIIAFGALILCSNVPILVMLLPTVVTCLHAFMLERIFRPYIKEQQPDVDDEENDEDEM